MTRRSKCTIALLSTILMISACATISTHEAQPNGPTKAAAQIPDTFRQYPAELFHQTTNFILASESGYVFSPDNSRILATSNDTGVFNAVLLDQSGVQTLLTTSSESSRFSQSFFPNDNRVILQGDQNGNELFHVFVREEDGTLRNLTPGENHRAFFRGWRADGAAFYIATNERDPQSDDLYEYDTTDYSRRIVFENDKMFIGPVSPDGKKLAVIKQISGTNADVYLADLTGANPLKLITPHEGNVAHSAYTFTPDSKNIVYGTNEFSEFKEAWTYNLENEERAPLIQADWDVTSVSYSPTGRYRVNAVNADAVTSINIFDIKTGQNLLLDSLPEGELGQVRFDRDEKRIAVGVNTDTSPINIFIVDLFSEEALRLTSALPPEIDESHLVTASVERYISFDGLEIPGILYKPLQASADNPVPALVYVHGGPGGQSTKGYSAQIQYLVNNGYAVFAANNRGSSGYGKTFFHLDDKRHGEDDLQDIVYAKAYLQTLDWVNGAKIGVMGGSYGGYITLAALAFEPDVFDVGVNIFGVSNWVRTLANMPAWWGAFRDAMYDEMGDPSTDAERHRRISPLFHASNIVKPLYVAQGANDPRVLQVESDEIVAAVKANGVPVDYVLFEDEGHGFRKRENRITNSERIIKFLNTHLRGDKELME